MNIKTVKDLAAAIKESGKTTQAYDTQATVTRVTGGTAWVHIPGGVDETPVQLSVNAKKGDTVNVRVSGGRAWITGNSTAPPTDDTAAKVANKNALKALKQIKKLDSQVKDLEEINYITEDTIHYLATDQDEGVTIETQGWTEEPQFIDETNRYLWIYHTYTLANGNTVDTDPVIAGVYGEEGPQGPTGATGATGETGATGKGISSVQPQYRLSTSSTSLVGGSWSTSLVYTSGYYIWTREKVTYDDGTVNYSTAIYDQALTTACSLAYDTAQYFWVNDTGTTSVPTGAYVTEVPQDTYKSNPSLGSILLRSAGIYIRYAAVTIAQFLSSGMTLFSSAGYKLAEFLSTGVNLYANDASNHKLAEFNTGGMSVYNGSGTEISHLGYGSGNSTAGASSDAPYYIIGVPRAGNTYSSSRSYNVGNVVTYQSKQYVAIAACSGILPTNTEYWRLISGNYSIIGGNDCVSPGFASCAIGTGCESLGIGTAAFGFHTRTTRFANATGQVVAGQYNANDDNAFFIVGNGTNTERSNAFAVYKNSVMCSGDVTILGSVVDAEGNTLLSDTGEAVSANVSTLQTPSHTGCTITGGYRTSGKMVFVNIRLIVNEAHTSGYTDFCTGLPTPADSLPAIMSGETNNHCIPCWVRANGELRVHFGDVDVGAGDTIYIAGSYISA